MYNVVEKLVDKYFRGGAPSDPTLPPKKFLRADDRCSLRQSGSNGMASFQKGPDYIWLLNTTKQKRYVPTPSTTDVPKQELSYISVGALVAWLAVFPSTSASHGGLTFVLTLVILIVFRFGLFRRSVRLGVAVRVHFGLYVIKDETLILCFTTAMPE